MGQFKMNLEVSNPGNIDVFRKKLIAVAKASGQGSCQRRFQIKKLPTVQYLVGKIEKLGGH